MMVKVIFSNNLICSEDSHIDLLTLKNGMMLLMVVPILHIFQNGGMVQLLDMHGLKILMGVVILEIRVLIIVTLLFPLQKMVNIQIIIV